MKQVEATNHYLLEERTYVFCLGGLFFFTKIDRIRVELRIRCMKTFLFFMNFILQSIQNKTGIKVFTMAIKFAMVDKFQTTRVFRIYTKYDN